MIIIISATIVSRQLRRDWGSLVINIEQKQTALKSWSYKWAGQRKGEKRKKKCREEIYSRRQGRSLAKKGTVLKSPGYCIGI